MALSSSAVKAAVSLSTLREKVRSFVYYLDGLYEPEDAVDTRVIDQVRRSIHGLTEEYFNYSHAAWICKLDPEKGKD